MNESAHTLFVSYGQLALYDAAMDRPFNFWTDDHFRQGFAWRPGSVSFATIREEGKHVIRVRYVEKLEPNPRAERIIRVPFQVPAHGEIELASITESARLKCEPGAYFLQFECFAPSIEEFDILLSFQTSEAPRFEVLRADATLGVPNNLLTTAEPA